MRTLAIRMLNYLLCGSYGATIMVHSTHRPTDNTGSASESTKKENLIPGRDVKY